MEGTVLTRKAEAGQIANPGGEVLFRVASGGEVEMRGQIAEQDLARVKTGQAATVYLTGIERPFTGEVRLLGAIIDPQTRLGDIRIQLKPDPALRPAGVLLAVFPLADPLPSPASATAPTALFGRFAATTGPSDFPRSFIPGPTLGDTGTGMLMAATILGASRVSRMPA